MTKRKMSDESGNDSTSQPVDQKKNVWQYFVGGAATAGPAIYGVLYVAGRTRYEAYVSEWGFSPDLFKLDATDLIYGGFQAEKHLGSFFNGLHGAFGILLIAALVPLIFLTLVYVVSQAVDRVKAKMFPARRGNSRDRPAIKPHWVDPYYRILMTVLSTATILFIVLVPLGTAALVGMRLIADKHRSAGLTYAQEQKKLYAEEGVRACDQGECSMPPISEVAFSEGKSIRRVKGWVVVCNDTWCGYRLADGQLLLVPTKSIVTSSVTKAVKTTMINAADPTLSHDDG